MSNVDFALTLAGQSLMAKIGMGGGDIPLEITRIVSGSGASENPLELRAVVDEKLPFKILNKEALGPYTIINVRLTNIGDPFNNVKPLEKGYLLSQIGIYAMDPDEGEILYKVSQFDPPHYVPAAMEMGWTLEPTLTFITANASEVVVQIDPTGYASKTDIWNSAELSADETPQSGVKTHYRVIADAPGYRPYSPPDEDPNNVITAVLNIDELGEKDGALKTDTGAVKELVMELNN